MIFIGYSYCYPVDKFCLQPVNDGVDIMSAINSTPQLTDLCGRYQAKEYKGYILEEEKFCFIWESRVLTNCCFVNSMTNEKPLPHHFFIYLIFTPTNLIKFHHIADMRYISNLCLELPHVETPVAVRSPKLSNVEICQYLEQPVTIWEYRVL